MRSNKRSRLFRRVAENFNYSPTFHFYLSLRLILFPTHKQLLATQIPFSRILKSSRASRPIPVDNSQSGNLLSLAARWGMATCWGSNGPSPVHVCLTDEMGLGFNSFYGFNASLNFVDRNDYGAVIAAER